MMSTTAFLLIVLFCCLVATPFSSVRAQHSAPVANNKDFRHSKLSLNSALEAADVVFGTYVDHRTNGTTDYGLGISWTTEVGSSVYAAPTIVDMFSDGRKEIIVPTFTHYLEVLDGLTGEDVKGWPFTHTALKTHSSVVMVDLDADGTQELIYTTATGELIFFEENGQALLDRTVRLPPLKLQRHWYKFASKSDESHDTHLKNVESERAKVEFQRQHRMVYNTQPPQKQQQPQQQRHGRRLHQTDQTGNEDGNEMNYDPEYYDPEGYNDPNMYGPQTAQMGTEGWLSNEARASMDLVYHPELFRQLEADSRRLATPEDVLFVHDDLDAAYNNFAPMNKDVVFVDPHVLATPVVVDLNYDGNLEAVVPVTYYFDKDYIAEHNITLPEDVDPENYLAGGIVVVDLIKREVKWSAHLDQSTRGVKHKANMYSSPVVVDVDRDGSLDVVVTTGMGFIYVFNNDGTIKKGWPKMMGEIQASPLVEDVNADGNLDICVADFNSNVVCFNFDGTEIWSVRTTGGVAEAMVAGDVDGNGDLDIVFGTTTGQVWAINGRTGDVLNYFPLKCKGAIMAPVLLVALHTADGRGIFGLNIIVPARDGVLYVFDPTSPLKYAMMDLAEESYNMVLAEDVNGNGMLDLVVSTMNGNIYVIETATKFHPSKAWRTFPHSLNVMSSREIRGLGIAVEEESRVYRDVVGDHFKIMFTITDNRRSVSNGLLSPEYHVMIKIGHRLIVHTSHYISAGTYVEFVATPRSRMYAPVVVTLIADSSQTYVDEFPLSFNMHFHTAMKWTFLIPFLALTFGLMFVRKADAVPDDEQLLEEYFAAHGGRYRTRRSAAPSQAAPISVNNDSDDSQDDDEVVVAERI
eukprot:PhM_4_TR11621/c1_g1_i1/m.77005